MSDLKISVDVQGAGRVTESIEEAIEDGIREGGAAIGQEGREIAKQRIRNVGAIFTHDLLESFDVYIRRQGNTLTVRLENTSDHAPPIEYGAEYTEKGPPVAVLIPWVEAKMQGYNIPEEEIEDLPEPEDLEEDTTIQEPGGDVTDLLDVVDRETINKAFWLQQHIRREGIDAVQFMRRAERWAEENGADTVTAAISEELHK